MTLSDPHPPGVRPPVVHPGGSGEPAFRVDPDELARLLEAFAAVGDALTEVRLRIAAVRRDAPGWAADDDLPAAAEGLIEILDQAAARGQVDARDLADAVRAAVRGYTDADAAAGRTAQRPLGTVTGDAWWREG